MTHPSPHKAERDPISHAPGVSRPLCVVLAGGGTGGHVFPAIALAEELLARSKAHRIVFVGTAHGLESKIIPQRGYPFRTLVVSGLKHVGLVKTLLSLARLPGAIFGSLRILREEKPDLVVGVGGYASGPVVLAARLRGIPTAILEQNSVPGLTNRILGRWVERVFITFEESKHHFPARKLFVAGNPIRRELREAALQVRMDEPVREALLVLGGSQGARALNELVPEAIEKLTKQGQKLPRIIHQTGAGQAEAIAERYRALGLSENQARVSAFIDDMVGTYLQAGLALSRAGATTLAELAALGVPAVLIPFPFAADDHQAKNAEALERAGAARVFREDELGPDRLAEALGQLWSDPAQLSSMRRAMLDWSRPDAAAAIADELEQMALGSGKEARK